MQGALPSGCRVAINQNGMLTLKRLFFLCLFVALMPTNVSAVVLVDFGGSRPDASMPLEATSTATGFASSDLALNVWEPALNLSLGVHFRISADFLGSDSVDDAISFVLTNNSGTDYNLAGFSYLMVGNAFNFEGIEVDAYRFSSQAQVDGVNIGSENSLEVIGQMFGGDSPANRVIAPINRVLADGASATFSIDTSWIQDLAGNDPVGTDGVGESVEFMRLADFAVEGDPIPEPSMTVLAWTKLFYFFRRRRDRVGAVHSC